MAFMDPKEEVLDIEITQYGKHLLSKGKFKPAYYAFFDDDVLYETQFAGYTEAQSASEGRITDTIQVDAQHAFHGIETEITRNNRLVRMGETELGSERIQPTPERHYSMTAPLGNALYTGSAVPSFTISYLKGKLSGSVEFLSSSFQTLRIPQLSSSVEYQTYIGKDMHEEDMDGMDIRLFEDGTYIKVEEDYLLLQIIEENTPFESANFDIEVFLRESVADGKVSGDEREQLIPLSFVDMDTKINSLLTINEEELTNKFPELDSNYVEYFMDINIDNEISSDVFCANISEEKRKSLFTDGIFIDCEEENSTGLSEIREILEPEDDDFEDCE